MNPKEIVLPNVEAPSCGKEDPYPVLSAQNLFSRGTFCLVDVRERDEIEALPVKGALALPLSEIEANIGESVAKLELEKLNALFCKSGKRSRKAFDLISQHKILVGNLVILDENAEKLAKI
jgi:rhodanese-related sulfurtransferase